MFLTTKNIIFTAKARRTQRGKAATLPQKIIITQRRRERKAHHIHPFNCVYKKSRRDFPVPNNNVFASFTSYSTYAKQSQWLIFSIFCKKNKDLTDNTTKPNL